MALDFPIETTLAMFVVVSDIELNAGQEGSVGFPPELAYHIEELLKRGWIERGAKPGYYRPTEAGRLIAAPNIALGVAGHA